MRDHRHAIEQWGADGFFFTEAARGGPLAWRIGGDRLEGDGLGPVRHAHDAAAEYYYMFSGSAHVETGSDQFVLEEGALGFIPPDAPHNFLGPASDKDACLFCLVAPNRVENKWRVRDFRSGAEELHTSVAIPFEDPELPGDKHLAARAISLDAGDEPLRLRPEGFEVVYLVVEGAAQLTLANGLSGLIEQGRYVHVRHGMEHKLGPGGGCRVLRMDAHFEAWHGVPSGADAE
jgi:mannose-6-phosphate isomerase-like protein (cupin superfamily)